MNEAFTVAVRETARILDFVLGAFAHTWPLWAVSIPLAALVRMSPLAGRLRKVVSMRPVAAVVAATAFGALSPLCSCSVVPVIFSLLTAGVPIAPVMAFWLASPSMDPEMFFLSVSAIGWPLATARLAAATLMSLGGGLATIALERKGFFRGGILRDTRKHDSGRGPLAPALALAGSPDATCSCGGSAPPASAVAGTRRFAAMSGSARPGVSSVRLGRSAAPYRSRGDGALGSVAAGKPGLRVLAWRFAKELLVSVGFVAKFMAIAFALEALIKFYVPEEWIRAALGADNAFAVPVAVLVGVPFYTTNAQALGMVGGLLGKGMSEGAALSFLIGGATTTLPAMSAVFGIARPRVFAVYLGSAVAAALLSGLAWAAFP